jgi:hypothetical protein
MLALVVAATLLQPLIGELTASLRPATPTATLAPTDAPTPTRTPSPTPTPPPVLAWEGTTLRVICLAVQQNYPEIEDKAPERIEEVIAGWLARRGLQVVSSGQEGADACDGRLSIELTGKALGANYGGAGTISYCYTGAEYRGRMVLEAEGRTALVAPIYATTGPSASAVAGCLGQQHARNAPFHGLWANALREGLEKLWGSPF